MRYYDVKKSVLEKMPYFNVSESKTNLSTYCLAFELGLTPWVEVYLASLQKTNAWIHLNGFITTIFGIFIQWLVGEPIYPFLDLSKDFLTGLSAPPAIPSNATPEITFATMGDNSSDHHYPTMPAARKLMGAYFMAQKLGKGARYFQDAILNLIIKHLHVTQAPPPALVSEIYLASWSKANFHGLKKLLVDAYVWACAPRPGQTARFPSGDFRLYPVLFRQDVTTTHADIYTKKFPVDAVNPLNPNNKLMRDVELDFTRLESSLCIDHHGLAKCRYHHHSADEMCFHLIVDDTPMAWPAGATST
jgi:hypothetical protein